MPLPTQTGLYYPSNNFSWNYTRNAKSIFPTSKSELETKALPLVFCVWFFTLQISTIKTVAGQDPVVQCSLIVRRDWGKGLDSSLTNSQLISSDNTDIKGIVSKRKRKSSLRRRETRSSAAAAVSEEMRHRKGSQSLLSVSPDLRSLSSPRTLGTAAHTTDLSDPASQQRAKCYFCICCLSCFKGHQKEDEKLMVLKVTAPKEERALEQSPAALARQGGREGEAKEEKGAGTWRGAQHPAPSCPTSAWDNKYYTLMFSPHSTNSIS